MNDDRKIICDIISEMLDNPDKCGIYPTTRCYDKLEQYIKDIREKKVGKKIEVIIEILERNGDYPKKEARRVSIRNHSECGGWAIIKVGEDEDFTINIGEMRDALRRVIGLKTDDKLGE